MLPLGHIAFAYIWYVPYAGLANHRLPAQWALLPLLFGSQLPDLIDKPLAYWGILYGGRSLGHSIFLLVILSGIVWWGCSYWRKTSPESKYSATLAAFAPASFTIAYSSHLLGDLQRTVLAGEPHNARWILWPIYPVGRSAASDIPPWLRMLNIYQNMETHPQIWLIILALSVFVALRIRAHIRRRRRSPESITSET